MKLCAVCHKIYPDDAVACLEHGDKLQTDTLIGKVVSSFKITSWLGEGGMGVLYRAEHTTISRAAAVKVIKKEFISDEILAGRFELEARAVSKISHPHLIDIFDTGTTEDGRVYYVMELLEGRSLSQKMAARQLSFEEFTPILGEAMEAIVAAHETGIVHRDLKPDNIFLIERPGEPPFAKVLDFGVAKVIGGDEDAKSRLTRTGSMVGTPQYMSPEQIDGSAIDVRSDVYALGVILYEISTGRLPFMADTLGAMLKAHLFDRPPFFDALKATMAPGVPASFEAVVFKAIAKKREERYATVQLLREDLERVSLGQAPSSAAWWVQERANILAMRTTAVAPGAAGGPRPTETTLAEQVELAEHAKAVAAERAAPSRMLVIGGAALAAALVISTVAVVATLRKPKPVVEQPVQLVTPVVAPPPKRKGPNLPALRSKAIGILADGMKSADAPVRRASALALASGKEPQHQSLIAPLLADPVPVVDEAAATALGRLGTPAAVPSLLDAFGKNPEIDGYIGEAIVKLGVEDRDRKVLAIGLKKAEKAKNTDVRLHASSVLCALGDKGSRAALAKIAVAPADAAGVVAPGTDVALEALARDHDLAALNRLAGELETSDVAGQVRVAETLAKLGDERGATKLGAIAANEQSPERLAAFHALASLDDQSGYDLFGAVFADSSATVENRALAAEGLGYSGEKAALDQLAPALDDTTPLVRAAAAGAVLAIIAADPQILAAQSLDWAMAALGDTSWVVRQQAVAVLADTDAAVALPLLRKAMHDDSADVRSAAAATLGRTGSAEAVELLGQALNDKQGSVRLAALKSMGGLDDKGVAPLLAEHYASASEEEKVITAAALQKRGDTSHADELAKALKSKNPEVRRLAVEAATSRSDVSLAPALKDKSFAVRFQAALGLAERGSKDGVAVLQEAVKKGGSDGLRAYAALLKLGVKPKAELDPRSLLDSSDANVRLSAVDGAQRLPSASALAFLRKALRDKDVRVRSAAVSVTGKISADKVVRPKGVALLKIALGDADPSVRAAAGLLLARLAPAGTSTRDSESSSGNGGGGATRKGTDSTKQPTPASKPAESEPDMMVAPQPGTGRDGGAAPEAAQPKFMYGASGPSLSQAAREASGLAMTTGEIALRSGRYPEAIREFQKAYKLNPKLRVFFSLGEAYRRLADREMEPAKRKSDLRLAIQSFRKAKEKKSTAYADELEAGLRN